MVSRVVTSNVESSDGRIIVNAMENALEIKGEEVRGFKECEVVTFNVEGKIERYELYCDPGPIMAVLTREN